MSRYKSLFKNITYVVGANFLSFAVSIFTSFIIPKFLGLEIEQFGYFQIYLFYVVYVVFFQLGLCEGIYLRIGGHKYENLDFSIYSGQFWVMNILQLITFLIILIFVNIFSDNKNYSFVTNAIALNIIILLPRTYLSFILQSTNRIKEYAAITTYGRTVYGFLIVLVIIFCQQNYQYFIICDILGKLIGLLIAIVACRDIVTAKPAPSKIVFCEIFKNIKIGSNLLFANIAGLLITGIVRIAIQMQWDVTTYGKISLALSVSNLFMIFVSAVSVVLYPILKRSSKSQLEKLYDTLNNLLMIPLFGCLVLYYPLMIFLSTWLPQYDDSLKYIAILFPLCIYMAKSSMITQTYMNVFRLEKQLFKVNLYGVILALITSILSVFILRNLTITVIFIVFNQVARTQYAEYVLSKNINIIFLKRCIHELAITILFIFSSWFIGGACGAILYAIIYALFLVINRNKVRMILKYFISSNR